MIVLLFTNLVLWFHLLVFIDPIIAYAFNQPKFCSNATWKVNATTVADGNSVDCSSNVIIVDKNNTIYLTIGATNRVQIWFNSDLTKSRNISSGLYTPQGLFLRENGDIFIDNGAANSRVDKWTLNATSGVSVMTVGAKCFSLFVDTNNTLYCAWNSQSKIVKRSLNSSNLTPTNVAGATGLLNAHGIFVDLSFNLYIAEYGGNQIKCVAAGASIATIAVGTNAPPPRTYTLNGPIAVMLDGNGYFFILEYGGNRLVAESSTGFRCIISCLGVGNAAYQLNTPYSFSFDIDGNILISDQSNCRLQKFFFDQNNCISTTTTSTTSTTTMTTTTTTSTSTTRTSSTSATTYVVTTEVLTTDSSIPITTSHSDEIPITSQFSTLLVNSTITSHSIDTSTTGTTINSTQNVVSISVGNNNQSTVYFIPPSCSSSTMIGTYCNTSNLPCNSFQPCHNNGTCMNNNSASYGYTCNCLYGFAGDNCELDYQLCSEDTCWHTSLCQEILNTTFHCNCSNGYQGNNCETKINYCKEDTCSNRGVCQSLLFNYTCICLSGSYSGRHCEIISNQLVVYETLSKSFSFVAIIAVSSVILFIIIMDVLKYIFGIDPAKPPPRKSYFPNRQKIIKRKTKVHAVHFTYVADNSNNIHELSVHTIAQSTI